MARVFRQSATLWRCFAAFLLLTTQCCYTDAITMASMRFCDITSYIAYTDSESGTILSQNYPEEIPLDPSIEECSMTISVCNGCRIQFVLSNITCFIAGSCGNDSVIMEEDGYENLTVKRRLCDFADDFTSRTQKLRVTYVKANSSAISGWRFYLHYKLLPANSDWIYNSANAATVRGHTGSTGTITSPGFPNPYLLNRDRFTYLLQNLDPGFVRLSFDDWYLFPDSRLKIYFDGIRYSQNLVSFVGAGNIRPFVLSTGGDLLLEFETRTSYANYNNNYVGFKATYLFVPDANWKDKPKIVSELIYHSVFGGAINANPRPSQTLIVGDFVDYVWIIPRSDVIESNADLKLRIDNATGIGATDLEIHRGVTSDGDLLSWSTGSSVIAKSGMYVRLRTRCSADANFSAVFAWIKPKTTTNSMRPYPCNNLAEFLCNSLECISTELRCNGIRECDDGSDELGCAIYTKKVCPAYWRCGRGDRVICVTRKCDGMQDCEDVSDELHCTTTATGTATTPFKRYPDEDWYIYQSYGTMSVVIPTVMIAIIIVTILCFVASFVVRRRRFVRSVRQATRGLRQNGSSAAAPGENVTSPSGGWPRDATEQRLMRLNDILLPPSYDDAVSFSNEGFLRADFTPRSNPPPYTRAKPDDDDASASDSLSAATQPPPYRSNDQETDTPTDAGAILPANIDVCVEEDELLN